MATYISSSHCQLLLYSVCVRYRDTLIKRTAASTAGLVMQFCVSVLLLERARAKEQTF